MTDKEKDKKNRKIVSLRVKRLKDDAPNGVGSTSGKSPISKMRTAWSRWGKKALMAASVVAGTCFLFPSVAFFQADEFQVGAIAKRDVVAPMSFQVFKDRGKLEQEKDREAAKVAPVFVFDETAADRSRRAFRSFLRSVDTVVEQDSLTSLERTARIGAINSEISPDAALELADRQAGPAISKAVESFIDTTLAGGVMEEKTSEDLGASHMITIVRGKTEFNRHLSEVSDLWDVRQAAQRRSEELFGDDREAAKAFEEAVVAFIVPNLRYDAAETESRRNQARESVSEFQGMVLKDELILAKHERITDEDVRKLNSLAYRQRQQLQAEGAWQRLQPLAGRLILATLLLAIFASFLKMHRPDIFRDHAALAVVTVSTLLVLGLASVVVNFTDVSPFVIPVVIAPMLVTVLLDDRVAILMTMVLSVLVGTTANLGLSFIVASMVAGIAGVYTAVRIRRRSQFYRALLFVFLGYFASISAINLIRGVALPEMAADAGWAALNATLSTMITVIVLPIFEMFSGVTTDITLLELSDLNRPLLRRMMLEAPGTYHHSMVVGQLAEAAAESIGANALLARVGAYYHDIGKLAKPKYFTENDPASKRRHERLTPTMSCLILGSHVKDGLDLGREEKLPKAILDFIREHHGNTLMAFFYHKALEMDPSIQEQDYRYPGPSPRSKETAIVMLADASEAASRSLAEPSPSRLRSLVKKIIESRANEGQLDQCQLTLRELALIRESFVKVLAAVFHGRIPYPTLPAKNAYGEDYIRKPTERG
jgi:putative nucleotidyltransferase with HDIG domain